MNDEEYQAWAAQYDWQTLPDWLPDGTFLRSPIKAHWATGEHKNYWVYETRHYSDGWVARISSAYSHTRPHWRDGSFEYVAYLAPGWIEE